MVEVGDRASTERCATAEGCIGMQPEVLELVLQRRAPKGDVLAVARIAAIQAAKRTWELIPLCHPIALTGIEVSICLLYTSPSPRDVEESRMPSSA